MNRAKERAEQEVERYESEAKIMGVHPIVIAAESEKRRVLVENIYNAGYAQGGADAHSVTRDSNADLEARI